MCTAVNRKNATMFSKVTSVLEVSGNTCMWERVTDNLIFSEKSFQWKGRYFPLNCEGSWHDIMNLRFETIYPFQKASDLVWSSERVFHLDIIIWFCHKDSFIIGPFDVSRNNIRHWSDLRAFRVYNNLSFLMVGLLCIAW